MDMRITGRRDIRLELLRPPGQLRGVGRVESGNDGGTPPTKGAAIASVQAAMLARAQAAAIATHPGAQGTAANPPNGTRFDAHA